jgi:hypothetical protein
MTSHDPHTPQPSIPDTPPHPTLPTLDYLPSPRPHPHTVKKAWPLTLAFWTGALSAGFLILLFHPLAVVGSIDVTRFLVILSQSTAVASFSACMFALAISGKIFRSRRQLIRRPIVTAFVLGAICVFVAVVSNSSPLQFVLPILVFGLATIYPMLSAQWLGGHVE